MWELILVRRDGNIDHKSVLNVRIEPNDDRLYITESDGLLKMFQLSRYKKMQFMKHNPPIYWSIQIVDDQGVHFEPRQITFFELDADENTVDFFQKEGSHIQRRTWPLGRISKINLDEIPMQLPDASEWEDADPQIPNPPVEGGQSVEQPDEGVDEIWPSGGRGGSKTRGDPKSEHRIYRYRKGDRIHRAKDTSPEYEDGRYYKFRVGNLKLSGTILIWSVSAPETCIGASGEYGEDGKPISGCIKYCYARRDEDMYENTYLSHKKNWESSMNPFFVRDVIEVLDYIITRHTKYLRIHEAGDFYNVKYANDWAKISRWFQKEFPNDGVYFYTKSAFVKNIDWPDNVKIWYSMGGTQDHLYPKTGNRAYVLDTNITREEALNIGIYLCPAGKKAGPDEWYVCGRDCDYCMTQTNNTGKKVGFPMH